MTEDKKKKIIYVITKGNWGGAQRYVYDLATAGKEADFDVSVAIGEGGLLNKKLEAGSIPVLAIQKLKRDVHLLGDIQVVWNLFLIFRKEKPDIVHLNSSMAGAIGALAGRLARVPNIIFTSHGWPFNELRPWWQKIAFYCIQWATIILAHTTIAVSHETKKQIAFLPFMKNKITVIPNGIKTLSFESRESARTHLASKNPLLLKMMAKEALWVGTIAELHKTKGLSYAIDAIKKYKEHSAKPLVYVIIGEGEESKNLEKQIQELNLQEHVFLAGFVPDASRLLSAFDIFLLSSLSEAFCYVLLEAGQAGLPAIATKVGGIPEIIDNGKSGLLVPAKESTPTAHALQALTNDKHLRTMLGNTLLEKTKKQFSFETTRDKTFSVYKKD